MFSDWGIPLGKYDGPTAACAKTPYSDPLSDIILDLLDNAHKHGDPECHVRANKGKVDVIQKGSNSTVYCFEEGKNLSTARMKISTSDMITVVKILSAEEDDDGKRAVESLVEGKTEYGRRQKILIRDADDDLATATSSANQILKDEGEPEKTLKVKTPDVPFIRKYDTVGTARAQKSKRQIVVLILSHMQRALQRTLRRFSVYLHERFSVKFKQPKI